MATKRVIPLNTIQGVAAGSTATISLPRNVRYHGVFLQYDTDTASGANEANMETEISEIRVELDQVTQRVCSAAQLFDINRTKGLSPTVGNGTAPGYLPLLFSEPQRETPLLREATAWGMQGVEEFTIQVDIANNSGQTPELKGFAVVDDVQEAPKGIVKWKRNNLTIASTGETPFKLATERGDSYQGLHLFETSAGDIDDVLIEWDGVKITDLTEYQRIALIDQMLKGGDTVSGNHHIPFDFNVPSDALRTIKTAQDGTQTKVQELIMTLNMGAANGVTMISELVGLPD